MYISLYILYIMDFGYILNSELMITRFYLLLVEGVKGGLLGCWVEMGCWGIMGVLGFVGCVTVGNIVTWY